MRSPRAFLAALAAVGSIGGKVDAGTVTRFGIVGAIAGAAAGVAHLTGRARFVAAAAVARIHRRLDASAGALGIPRVTNRAALAAFAGSLAVGGRVANLAAGAAVIGARLHVDARTVTLLRAVAALEVASGIGTSGSALGRHRAA